MGLFHYFRLDGVVEFIWDHAQTGACIENNRVVLIFRSEIEAVVVELDAV